MEAGSVQPNGIDWPWKKKPAKPDPQVITVPAAPKHPSAGSPLGGTPIPRSILELVPPGPERYAAGDPVAILRRTAGSAPVEAYVERDPSSLVQPRDRSGERVPLRALVRTAFQHAEAFGTSQAIFQASNGERWIGSLTTAEGKSLPIDSFRHASSAVHGESEHGDLLAIVGENDVINFSDEPVRKGRWYDALIGKDYSS